MENVCVDCMGLNSITAAFPFPVSDAQTCFDRLADSNVFSRLDLKSG
jgi:hypothetical protein